MWKRYRVRNSLAPITDAKESAVSNNHLKIEKCRRMRAMKSERLIRSLSANLPMSQNSISNSPSSASFLTRYSHPSHSFLSTSFFPYSPARTLTLKDFSSAHNTQYVEIPLHPALRLRPKTNVLQSDDHEGTRPSLPQSSHFIGSNSPRLLQFMQRATASQAQRSPQTPASPNSAEPNESPTSKRRKTDTRTPNYGRVPPDSSSPVAPQLDLQRVQAALDEEEAKRERAIEMLAAEAGETKWVLSTLTGQGSIGTRLRVARAGYGDIDEGEGGSRQDFGGRRSFGRFNREIEVRHHDTMLVPRWNNSIGSTLIFTTDMPEANHSLCKQKQNRQNGIAPHSSHKGASSEPNSDDEDGEDGEAEGDEDNDDDENDPAGTGDLIQAVKGEATQRAKADRKAKRKAEKRELTRLAEQRKGKEVKLNRLSSISGGGGISGGGVGMSDRESYQCGEKGHERKDCPQRGEKQVWSDGSRKRKKPGDLLDY